MKLTKKTIGFILLALLGMVGVGYLIYRSRSGAAETNSIKDPEERAAFDAMITLFKQKADPGALTWLLPIYQSARSTGTLNGAPVHPDYMVNGQLTAPGAFIATYAAAYSGPDSGGVKAAAFSKLSGTPGSDTTGYGYLFLGKKGGEPGYAAARLQFAKEIYAIFYNYRNNQLTK